jgi:D-serine deaminase-like pyridoxal phosphate-dependent protein
VNVQDVFAHPLIARFVAAVTAARRHNHRARDLGSGRIEVHCAAFDMEDSVDRMENVSQREGDFARLWIDFETLLLRERVACQQERQSQYKRVGV